MCVCRYTNTYVYMWVKKIYQRNMISNLNIGLSYHIQITFKIYVKCIVHQYVIIKYYHIHLITSVLVSEDSRKVHPSRKLKSCRTERVACRILSIVVLTQSLIQRGACK